LPAYTAYWRAVQPNGRQSPYSESEEETGFTAPFYNILAISTFGALILYGTKFPDREIYRIRGVSARLMRFTQIAAVTYMLYGIRQIGFFRFYGVSNLTASLKGQTFAYLNPKRKDLSYR
jgi:hypothetical protein